MHRVVLACRSQAAAAGGIISHASKLGVVSFETPFLPPLAKHFPAHSTVFLKTASLTAGEVEFQARSFRAQLLPTVNLVLLLLDPEFQTVDLDKRLREFFTVSQGLCDTGVVNSFGVSSNGLANNRLTFATIQQALESGMAFKHVQFPLNMLEYKPELLDHLPKGWEVSTNRPFTVFDDKQDTYRLVDGDFPPKYQQSLDDLLLHFTPPPDAPNDELIEACAWLRNLFSQLDEQLARFTSVLHWERELQQVVLPMVNEKFDELDEDTVRLMEEYFKQYTLAVRESGGVKSRERLGLESSQSPLLQELAFKFALEKNPTGKVAVHASSTAQVDDWSRWVTG
ncbi:hypothetical protein BASA81_000257 [Batrachochytrium salamandrivorans]|nr:hypothetical protein BASA81_000257 [Batrachochytrium salamandrivorans]